MTDKEVKTSCKYRKLREIDKIYILDSYTPSLYQLKEKSNIHATKFKNSEYCYILPYFI